MYMSEAAPRWPPVFMAGDAHDGIGWRRWISKEETLTRASSSLPSSTFFNRPLLEGHMSTHRLAPDPAYAAASSHLRGPPRYEWARFAAGHGTKCGIEPSAS